MTCTCNPLRSGTWHYTDCPAFSGAASTGEPPLKAAVSALLNFNSECYPYDEAATLAGIIGVPIPNFEGWPTSAKKAYKAARPSGPSTPKEPEHRCMYCGKNIFNESGHWVSRDRDFRRCYSKGRKNGEESHAPEPVAGTQVESLHDKNGHRINFDGSLAYDPECTVCERPRVAGTASAPQDLTKLGNVQLLDEFRLMAVRLSKTNDEATLRFVQAVQVELLSRLAAPSVAGTPAVARCPKCGGTKFSWIRGYTSAHCYGCKADFETIFLKDFAQFFSAQPLRTPPDSHLGAVRA